MNVLQKLFPLYCILIYNVANIIDCARILCVFSSPILSHSIVFRSLTNALLGRGHELVVLTSFPEYLHSPVANLTEIDVGKLSFEVWKAACGGLSEYIKADSGAQRESVVKLITQMGYAHLKHNEIEKLIKDENRHFDIIFIETPGKLFYTLSYIFKAPIILASSMGDLSLNDQVFGYSAQPLLYPPFMAPKFNNLLFWEKINVLYDYVWYQNICKSQDLINNGLLKKHFGEDTPNLEEIYSNLHMMFLNVHTSWDANRPIPLGIVFTGGLHLKPETILPEDLKMYLDSSKNGIIYVSFGTNMMWSLFPQDKLNVFLNVFSELPYDILFKWDQDLLPGCPENVKIFKWLPQADLLRHQKIKLFITQGGLQSTDEAINAGVPLIGIPILGDQWFNAEKYEQHKIGIKLDFYTLTEQKLNNAIETVIEDKSYRHNVLKLRVIMNDKPQASLDHAIWWTEYVLRHSGTEHLRAVGANLSWSEYYEVDIVVMFLASFMTVLILAFYFVHLLYKNVIRKLLNNLIKKTIHYLGI